MPSPSVRFVSFGQAVVAACLLLGAALLEWQPPRELTAALVTVAYLTLCLVSWRHHRHSKAIQSLAPDALLIAYASQGGQARELAERSAAQLHEAGLTCNVLPLNRLDTLQGIRRALFIVSTYGEGEAPDNAARFERRLSSQAMDLSHLEFAVLALGDARYSHFCGFGQRLDARLRERQAAPLFDLLCADRGDSGILRHWQHQLGHLSGRSDYSDWQSAPYQPWRLDTRARLNPGSSGAPVFHLTLGGPATAFWQAGDIAEIGPQHPLREIEALLLRLGHDPHQPIPGGQTLALALSKRRLSSDETTLADHDVDALLSLPLLPHREYSIASVPADGTLELLVREARHADGRLGLGSGWLCQHAVLGGELALRIRSNPNFHGPAHSTPMILIGNGTGLAGLRAHLRERAAVPGSRNWLLFGERNQSIDYFFQQEIEHWLRTGHLQRLDLAFSRDQLEKRYVQHALRDAADELRCWIDAGAALYVCGSLEGMGRDVQQILVGLLGEAQLNTLSEQGRYRRDLY
ncbi:sulfite reductase subunit alpha [Stutzerimonas xanthomarina]|uniref:NADPH--hemoprotein reductase n=2 Tax=Stutzerimonas xanthomarina TaxID=271420 RepID=A0A1M5K738_9GAMM|nr:sulfite reductase subunit alpha [Stutzerimonas xanthomarina]MCP9339810.1 sulfite reductase subunit alpha [Stutzerimonas xanthomarina]SEI04748.1 sulfite reductase (NADPH) flavoprotein alpha-component [Stutzerimonas xanthomarina]SHG48319.1 sulfite reductase (NADPH) flavoprotein alpha-component [Stutzerimonas xanthomarina DSM 18231]